ncbi:MAG: hypothetical protein J2P17_22760, partial [Mycobacterium sp.]|nr:hypothetical protein [Mycobacterium sp.]
QNAGHTTVKSVAVFEAARAAGFNDDNVRIQASKHPDITVIDCKGGIATWSLVPGAQPRPKLRPAAEWFDSWLDQQTSDQVRPQDVRTAAQAAGYAWMTIRKAACASPRIRSVPARGEAVSERIWIIKAAQDEGTAS